MNDNINYKGIIEGILFASGDPIAIDKIANTLNITNNKAAIILDEMSSDYLRRDGGIRLLKLGDNYQLATKGEYSEYIKTALDSKKGNTLSSAAMEVLAIVAYNQPITRTYVEQIRGVDCTYTMSSLVEKGLIIKKGNLDAPGRPGLYVTTYDFLRCFNLHSIEELPSIENVQMSIDLDLKVDKN